MNGDREELRLKFEACYGSNILNMKPEYDPYSAKKKINNILYDDKPLSIKQLPRPVLDRFMEITPGLTAHKLSYTCKELYVDKVKRRGFSVRFDSFDPLPRVYHDGAISVNLNKIHQNLLSYMKVQTIDIGKYNEKIEKFGKSLTFVAEKHTAIKIVTDSNSKHHKFLHPGIQKAIIDFCNDDDDIYETLKQLPNVKYAVLNFYAENNFHDLQGVKSAFKKWIETKPTPIISVYLDMREEWYLFYDRKFYKILGTEFIFVEDL
uniref:F-box domain-containing protein n=1 Tax=Panagrolaimus sp. JU765 TaxID=591449 RepID=A0AC34RTG9_9BILA